MINNTCVALIESMKRQNEKQLEDSKKEGEGLYGHIHHTSYLYRLSPYKPLCCFDNGIIREKLFFQILLLYSLLTVNAFVIILENVITAFTPIGSYYYHHYSPYSSGSGHQFRIYHIATFTPECFKKKKILCNLFNTFVLRFNF